MTRIAAKAVAAAVALPWLYYVALMSVLSLAERIVQPSGLNPAPDIAFNLIALAGLVVTALRTVAAMRLATTFGQRGAVATAIIVAGFLGPLLCTVAVVSLVRDVDGSTWILASPVFGLLITAVAIVVVAIRSRFST